jgi:hypothetical protein
MSTEAGPVTTSLRLSQQEKRGLSILLIGPELGELIKLSQKVGVPEVSHSHFHGGGFRRLMQRSFTHVIFSVNRTDMSAIEFIRETRSLLRPLVLIAAADAPTSDLIADLLVQGANAFLCLPTSEQMLDLVLGQATKGQKLNVEVLRSEKRNEILIKNLMTNLDHIASRKRTAMMSTQPDQDIPRLVEELQLMASTLRVFAAGGPTGLLNTLVEIAESLCVDKTRSRLGNVRHNLHKLAEQRAKKDPEKDPAE